MYLIIFSLSLSYMCASRSLPDSNKLICFIYTDTAPTAADYRQCRHTYQNTRELWKEIDDLLSNSRP